MPDDPPKIKPGNRQLAKPVKPRPNKPEKPAK